MRRRSVPSGFFTVVAPAAIRQPQRACARYSAGAEAKCRRFARYTAGSHLSRRSLSSRLEAAGLRIGEAGRTTPAGNSPRSKHGCLSIKRAQVLLAQLDVKGDSRKDEGRHW